MERVINPTIAQLATLCDESGLTRCQIAERAGMSPGDLSRLLSGRRDPAISTFDRVRKAIGATWADFDESA